LFQRIQFELINFFFLFLNYFICIFVKSLSSWKFSNLCFSSKFQCFWIIMFIFLIIFLSYWLTSFLLFVNAGAVWNKQPFCIVKILSILCNLRTSFFKKSLSGFIWVSSVIPYSLYVVCNVWRSMTSGPIYRKFHIKSLCCFSSFKTL